MIKLEYVSRIMQPVSLHNKESHLYGEQFFAKNTRIGIVSDIIITK